MKKIITVLFCSLVFLLATGNIYASKNATIVASDVKNLTCNSAGLSWQLPTETSYGGSYPQNYTFQFSKQKIHIYRYDTYHPGAPDYPKGEGFPYWNNIANPEFSDSQKHTYALALKPITKYKYWVETFYTFGNDSDPYKSNELTFLSPPCRPEGTSKPPAASSLMTCNQKHGGVSSCQSVFSCTGNFLSTEGTSCLADKYTCCSKPIKTGDSSNSSTKCSDYKSGGLCENNGCSWDGECNDKISIPKDDPAGTGSSGTGGSGGPNEPQTPPTPPKPSVPVGLTLSAPVCSAKTSDGTISTTLTWGQVDGATNYKVYLWNGQTWGDPKGETATLSFNWTGLKQKTGHTFGVEAFNAQGEGSGIAFIGIGTPVDCREKLKIEQAAVITLEGKNAENEDWRSDYLKVVKNGKFNLRAKITVPAGTPETDIKYRFFCNKYAGLPQYETTTKEKSATMPNVCTFQTTNKRWDARVEVNIGGKDVKGNIGSFKDLPIILVDSSRVPSDITPVILSPTAVPTIDANCPAPYKNKTISGACVWTCGEGSGPGTNNTCVCLDRKVEAGTDKFGRKICKNPSDNEVTISGYVWVEKDNSPGKNTGRGDQPYNSSGTAIISATSNGTATWTATDSNGYYKLVLPAGTYDLEIKAPGYKVWNSSDHPNTYSSKYTYTIPPSQSRLFGITPN